MNRLWPLFLVLAVLIRPTPHQGLTDDEREVEGIVKTLSSLNVPSQYLWTTAWACHDADIPPIILTRLIKTESNWNPKATGYNRNGSKDYGIAQLNSRYLHAFAPYNKGIPIDPYNPYQAIPVAAKHLSAMFNLTGTWYGALASYNAGYSRFKSGKLPKSTIAYVDEILKGVDLTKLP